MEMLRHVFSSLTSVNRFFLELPQSTSNTVTDEGSTKHPFASFA